MEAWSFDSRRPSRGEARLEVGEDGGGCGELLCARDRNKATGGGDRREGAAGNELSSALSEGRRKRELSEQIRTEKD